MIPIKLIPSWLRNLKENYSREYSEIQESLEMLPNKTVATYAAMQTSITADPTTKRDFFVSADETNGGGKSKYHYDGAEVILESKLSQEGWCVIRNTGGTWEAIDESDHVPNNITSVTNGINGFAAEIAYPNTKKVGSAYVSIDETYAENGVFAGASVARSSQKILIAKQGFGVYISYDGANWNALTEVAGGTDTSFLKAVDFSFSFNTASGVLTVTHNNAVIRHDVYGITASPRTGIDARLGIVRTNSFDLTFYNIGSTTALLTPNTNMRCFVMRSGMWLIPNSKSAIDLSNIWLRWINKG